MASSGELRRKRDEIIKQITQIGQNGGDASTLQGIVSTMDDAIASAEATEAQQLGSQLTEEQIVKQGEQNRLTDSAQARQGRITDGYASQNELRSDHYGALTEAEAAKFAQQSELDSLYYTAGLNAADNPNQAQIQQGLARYGEASDFYSGGMKDGYISEADEGFALSSAFNDVTNQVKGMQSGINASAAQRGVAGSAMGTGALGLAGQFAGAAARGDAREGIRQERNANRQAAAAGYADVAGSLAELDTMPTFEGTYGNIGQVAQPGIADYNVPAPDYTPAPGTEDVYTDGYAGTPEDAPNTGRVGGGGYGDDDDDDEDGYGPYEMVG